MTSIDELRRMLDERGVEYKAFHRHYKGYANPDNDYTNWHVYGDGKHISGSFHENDGSVYFSMHAYGVTPEQAIAATLGRQKVKKVRGLTYDEHGGEVYYLACSGCGDWVDGDLGCIGEYDGPNFCHNCGGEFDGPLMCKVCGELADMEFGDMCAECYWHEGEGNDER